MVILKSIKGSPLVSRKKWIELDQIPLAKSKFISADICMPREMVQALQEQSLVELAIQT